MYTKSFAFLLFIVLFFTSIISNAGATKNTDTLPEPWFTGPLVAPSGHTVPPGNLSLEPYLYYGDDLGIYNNVWQRTPPELNQTYWSPTLVAYYGLSDRFDIATIIPYWFTDDNNNTDSSFADIGVNVSFQARNEVPGTWLPDIKLTIQEIFPVGKYDNLNPALEGADVFGVGSYQTSAAVTFQKLWNLSGRFLRVRLSFGYTIPSDVRLRGLNVYGGAPNTNGILALGNEFSTILGVEYTITQHWVPAIDFVFESSARNYFSGFAGSVGGDPASIGESASERFSIAPAVEYNFSQNMGLIAGIWFSIAGRNINDFVSGAVAFNYNIAM